MFFYYYFFSLQFSLQLVCNNTVFRRILALRRLLSTTAGLLPTGKLREQFNQSFAASTSWDIWVSSLDHNIQNPAVPFLTVFRMIYDARAVHVRQCKLNETLSWVRYFHERLQRTCCCACLVKKSTRRVFPARKRGSLLIHENEIRRGLLSMALFIQV